MFTYLTPCRTISRYSKSKRGPFVWFSYLAQNASRVSSSPRVGSFVPSFGCSAGASSRNYTSLGPFQEAFHGSILLSSVLERRIYMSGDPVGRRNGVHARYLSNASIELKTDNDVVRFSVGKQLEKDSPSKAAKKKSKCIKKSRKAKLNELRWYRLKAKKKMNSPNPEVRIRYKLEKAKRKEEWLIEKLRKFEVPKAPPETHDPEILTEEERHYLKRTGEKKKNYVKVGRRGVFGGVVLNMHLHWKKHETVKVICKPCKHEQIHEYAQELARLSKGIVIDIKPDNTIIFYRGKNYVQPEVMSPTDTLSKAQALEKYKYMQSLEHTSRFIEKLEKELEDYHKHLARYKKNKENAPQNSIDST